MDLTMNEPKKEAKMCKSHNPRVIDKCMEKLINNLEFYLRKEARVVACCCGHGKYPMTIIVKKYYQNSNNFLIIDLCSNRIIPRVKRFYIKDKEGYYYIPEVVECQA